MHVCCSELLAPTNVDHDDDEATLPVACRRVAGRAATTCMTCSSTSGTTRASMSRRCVRARTCLLSTTSQNARCEAVASELMVDQRRQAVVEHERGAVVINNNGTLLLDKFLHWLKEFAIYYRRLYILFQCRYKKAHL